jgi:hypothetical protein
MGERPNEVERGKFFDMADYVSLYGRFVKIKE